MGRRGSKINKTNCIFNDFSRRGSWWRPFRSKTLLLTIYEKNDFPFLNISEPEILSEDKNSTSISISLGNKPTGKVKIVFELSKQKQPIINRITHGINKIVWDDKSVNIFILKTILDSIFNFKFWKKKVNLVHSKFNFFENLDLN